MKRASILLAVLALALSPLLITQAQAAPAKHHHRAVKRHKKVVRRHTARKLRMHKTAA